MKTPAQLTRQTFLALVQAAFAACGWILVEAVVFLEFHERTEMEERSKRYRMICRQV